MEGARPTTGAISGGAAFTGMLATAINAAARGSTGRMNVNIR